MAVAIDQHHGFKPFNRSQRCRLQSFTHFDYNILEPNQTYLTHSLKQAFEISNIHRSFSTPSFSQLATRLEEDNNDAKPRIEIVGGHGAPKVHALVVEVAIAVASNVEPMPVLSGLGGAYLLLNRNGDNIAIAKPIDEEPLAFNNPKGFGGLMLGQPGMKRSIKVGGTGIRELAAYLLDHGGFAGVPPTALVKIAHVGFHNINNENGANSSSVTSPSPYKIASLQRFVAHDFDAGELGFSRFSVASVHQIGIFDVRILNLDRHAGNILVKKNDQDGNYTVGVAELVPIDHGLCLPEWLDNPYFEWLHWPQASIPFSEYELEYISNLDPFKDAEILRNELPSLRESSIRVLIICTIFLKQAAAAGLCLADIGKMMTREFCGGEERSSIIENLCAKAKANVVNVANKDDYDEDDDYEEGNTEENEQTREEEEASTIFQFDDENENNSKNNDLDNLPQLLKSPPMIKVRRISSVRSMPKLQNSTLSPSDEENNGNGNKETMDIVEENDNGSKLGGLTRSISYSIQNYNCEMEGISLGDMSKREWELFLESFEKLLPEGFQATNCMDPKQRLGTSCKL